MSEDYTYLLVAHTRGWADVRNPEHRVSLRRAGLMVPCKARRGLGGAVVVHAMTLTKAGQKRAKELYESTSHPLRLKYDRKRLNRTMQKLPPRSDRFGKLSYR